MSASPRAHEELLRYMARAEFGGDIHCRVAHPDNENALAPEVDRREWVAISMRMDLRAVEVPRISGFRPAAIPMMPVADEQGVIGADLAVAETDAPCTLPVKLSFSDFRLQPNFAGQAKPLHVGLQIGKHLRMVQIVRRIV